MYSNICEIKKMPFVKLKTNILLKKELTIIFCKC